MASIVANLSAPPAFLAPNRTTLFSSLPKASVFPVKDRQSHVSFVLKAVGDSSDSSSSLSIIKSVQIVWEDEEDRWALAGLGFGAIVAFWASVNLVSAVDKLPIIPGVLELIGIFYSSWFIYRYLLFKPDREELFQNVNKVVSEVLGK